MSGYQDCACRDCFDPAIGNGSPTLCGDCEKAGCEKYDAEAFLRPHHFDCQREDVYEDAENLSDR